MREIMLSYDIKNQKSPLPFKHANCNAFIALLISPLLATANASTVVLLGTVKR